MPTYEYACKNCDETFEVFQSFSDKPLKNHETCGGDLQKVFHASGIVFKGGGFYATDSKPSNSSKSSASSDSDSSSDSSSDSGSDSSDKKSDKPKAASSSSKSSSE